MECLFVQMCPTGPTWSSCCTQVMLRLWLLFSECLPVFRKFHTHWVPVAANWLLWLAPINCLSISDLSHCESGATSLPFVLGLPLTWPISWNSMDPSAPIQSLASVPLPASIYFLSRPALEHVWLRHEGEENHITSGNRELNPLWLTTYTQRGPFGGKTAWESTPEVTDRHSKS